MALGGLIVNRVNFDGLGESSVEDVEALLAPELGERLAARMAGNLPTSTCSPSATARRSSDSRESSPSRTRS